MSEEINDDTRMCYMKMEHLEKLFESAKSSDLTQSQFEEHKTRRIECLAQAIKALPSETQLMVELLETINSKWEPYNPFPK